MDRTARIDPVQRVRGLRRLRMTYRVRPMIGIPPTRSTATIMNNDRPRQICNVVFAVGQAAAFAGSTAWEFVFPAGMYGLSVALIVITLVSLAVAVGRVAAWRTPFAGAERWLVWMTCGVYLGWITVATIANVAQALSAAGIVELGLGGEAWGMVMLAAAALIGAFVTRATRNAGFALAVVWALIAVFVARRSPPVLTQSAPVAYVALAAAAVVGAALVLSRARRMHTG
jgi:hypothetical protein